MLRSRTASIWAVTAFGLYSVLDHAALISGTPLAAGLAFVQLSFFGAMVLLAVPYRHKWLAGGALCLMIGALCWRAVQTSLIAAAAIPHTVAYLGLLTVFGTSLLPGRDALITSLARHIHAPISDEMAAYTRMLTWIWSAFFAAQLSVSLLLFLFAPLHAWSFFVNVLNLPLLAIMVVGEKGSHWVGLKVKGTPGHGSMPYGSDNALVKAAEWMLGKQILVSGDWQVKRPHVQPGGWAFQYGNDFYPDLDDTAMVLMALEKIRGLDGDRVDQGRAAGELR